MVERSQQQRPVDDYGRGQGAGVSSAQPRVQ